MPHSSGGGSHGGGSHGGSHGRGSSGHRTSHSYFPGSTRYAYYHKGRIEYYYRDAEYTAEDFKDRSKSRLITALILCVFYAVFIAAILAGTFNFPRKLTMDYQDTSIVISDGKNLLSDDDLIRIGDSFSEFQDKTGITPSLLIIDNSEWMGHYTSFENYAYEYYVQRWDDEKHWLIVYSTDSDQEWEDWYWEGMQGDDTDHILTTKRTDAFREDFQKGLLQNKQSFTDTFLDAFDSLTDVCMEKSFDPVALIALPFIVLHAAIFFYGTIFGAKKNEEKARNSVKLEKDVQYVEDTCKWCGGLYIHGIHLSCPHCGGTIDPLGEPINVASPESLIR